MKALYLACIIIGISAQNILKKAFSLKNTGDGVYTFCLLTSLSSMAFFIFSSRDLQWNIGLIPYAVFFALSFAAATIFSTLSLSWGPLSLTSLITSFSQMIPTFYGLIFLKEPTRIGLFPGLALLSTALILINKKSKSSPVTFKWLLCVTIAFLGNGMCSVVQKMQQNAFSGAYKNEFMIMSMAIVAGIMLGASFIKERRGIRRFIRTGWYLSISYGIMNALVNLFVMILGGIMSVSLMFPLVSVGSILVTFIVSIVFYKEKLTHTQFIGFLSGIVAIVLLNL